MNITEIEIGASEASRPLGLCHYETPLAFFARKLGHDVEERDETEAQELGNAIEPALAAVFEKRYGCQLVKGKTLFHPTLPWLRATPDYELHHENASQKARDLWNLQPREVVVVEMKTAGLATFFRRSRLDDDWGPSGGDHVPADYAAQVHTQIAVVNEALRLFDDGFCRRGFVVPLLAGRGVPLFRVEGDDEVRSFLLHSLAHFVEHHLVPEVPPPATSVDDWKIGEALLTKPMKTKTRRRTTEDEDAAVLAWRAAKEAADFAELDVAQKRNKLISMMGEDYGWESSWGRLLYTQGSDTLKVAKAAAFDAIVKAFENDPGPAAERIREIVEKHTRTTHTGRQLRPTWADKKKG